MKLVLLVLLVFTGQLSLVLYFFSRVIDFALNYHYCLCSQSIIVYRKKKERQSYILCDHGGVSKVKYYLFWEFCSWRAQYCDMEPASCVTGSSVQLTCNIMLVQSASNWFE